MPQITEKKSKFIVSKYYELPMSHLFGTDHYPEWRVECVACVWCRWEAKISQKEGSEKIHHKVKFGVPNVMLHFVVISLILHVLKNIIPILKNKI